MPERTGPLRFIVLEGGEGSGKTTQAGRLADGIRGQGYDVLLTREPGGTIEAEKIRAMLVESDGPDWEPLSEALLICAARAEHLEKVIRPALNAGKWVVCDRFADSTMAYQGYGQGVDREVLRRLRSMVVGSTEPGLTIIFDLPVDAGLARVARNQRYERLGREFHERLRLAFQEIAKDTSLPRRTIDASGNKDQVWRRLADEVVAHFDLRL